MEKYVFYDSKEIEDKFIKHDAFIGSNGVNFLFGRAEKRIFIICSTKNMCLTTKKWKS